MAFKNEEKDVQTMQDINNLLIENILPRSVAAKFLSPDRNNEVKILASKFFLGALRSGPRKRLRHVRQYPQF